MKFLILYNKGRNIDILSKLILYTVEVIPLFMSIFEEIKREIGSSGVMNPLGIYPHEFDEQYVDKDISYQ